MNRIVLLSLCVLLYTSGLKSQTWPSGLAGRWTFDNSSDLTHAETGSDLILHGTHQAVAGPAVNDSAVLIGPGSYYECTHNIPANGGGSTVNEYTILFDFMVTDISTWHCFLQTNMSNGNDGDIFINTTGHTGISTTGYSGFSILSGQWYRLVVAVDLGASFRYYLDGRLILDGISQDIDGRFSLDIPTLLLFADDDAEDNDINVAQVALFNRCLTGQEILGMGGYSPTNIKPYLQSPANNSIYVSWLSAITTSTKVQYGADTTLGLTASGAYEDVLGNIWHTVKLSGLQQDATYFYRCISGVDTSEIYPFHTPPLAGNDHLRFIKIGDSQTNFYVSKTVADSIKALLFSQYGNDWYKEISFIFHTGDLVGDGANIHLYQAEFFNPFAGLSCSVPFMVSIGNHEGESGSFYSFMKYEDFSDYSSPNPLAEKYYSFILGDAQFIALNTNGDYNNTIQTSWLDGKLASSEANPGIDFVFSFSHQPGHSELWPDGNNNYVMNNVYGTLASYPKVMMHATGHTHGYERGVFAASNSLNRDFRTLISGGAAGTLDRWGDYTNQTDYPEIHTSFDYHNFVIVDIDMANRSYNAAMYSLGNPDKPATNAATDTWHCNLNYPAPAKPVALLPDSIALLAPTLVASPFSGSDSIMTSQFQLTEEAGTWAMPIMDVTRNWENIYGDSGSPDFVPEDLNEGIDLTQQTVPGGLLAVNSAYQWRIRYRDKSLRWSDWSEPAEFTVDTVTTGTNEISANELFYLYQGPGEKNITFRFKLNMQQNVCIDIYDINGRMVDKPVNKTFEPGTYSIDWNVADTDKNNLAKGIYIAKVTRSKSVMTLKFKL